MAPPHGAPPDCSCESSDTSNEFDHCFITHHKFEGRVKDLENRKFSNSLKRENLYRLFRETRKIIKIPWCIKFEIESRFPDEAPQVLDSVIPAVPPSKTVSASATPIINNENRPSDSQLHAPTSASSKRKSSSYGYILPSEKLAAEEIRKKAPITSASKVAVLKATIIPTITGFKNATSNATPNATPIATPNATPNATPGLQRSLSSSFSSSASGADSLSSAQPSAVHLIPQGRSENGEHSDETVVNHSRPSLSSSILKVTPFKRASQQENEIPPSQPPQSAMPGFKRFKQSSAEFVAAKPSPLASQEPQLKKDQQVGLSPYPSSSDTPTQRQSPPVDDNACGSLPLFREFLKHCTSPRLPLNEAILALSQESNAVQMIEIKKENAVLYLANAELREVNEGLSASLSLLKTRTQDLISRSVPSNEQLEESVKQNAEISRLKALVEEKEVTRRGLSKHVSYLENNLLTMQKQADKWSNQVSVLDVEKKQLEQNIKQEKENVKKAEKEVELLRKEVECLKEKEKVGSKDIQSRMKSYVQENVSLKNQLNDVRKDNSALKNQVNTIGQEKTKIKYQLDKFTNENGFLKNQINAMSVASQENSAQTDALDQENRALKSQMNDDNSAIKNQLKTISQENAALKSRIDHVTQENTALNNQVNSKDQELNSLKRPDPELESLKKKLDAAIAEKVQLTEKVSNLEMQLASQQQTSSTSTTAPFADSESYAEQLKTTILESDARIATTRATTEVLKARSEMKALGYDNHILDATLPLPSPAQEFRNRRYSGVVSADKKVKLEK